MSCPDCERGEKKLDWRWKVGALCLVVGILLNFVHLPPEWKADTWLQFADGLLLGGAVAFLFLALMGMRKKQD